MPTRARSAETANTHPTGVIAEETPFADFTDIAGFVALPRITALALSPDGKRLVAAVQRPDANGSKYVSALWEVDPEGLAEPRRLTFSVKGESAPRFAPDGALLFTSARPDTEGEQNGSANNGQSHTAIWRLREHGEARVVADAPGGLGIAGVAADGRLLATGSVVAGGSSDTDAEARKRRKDRGVTAILHTGMPIRYWDHEINDTSPRLNLVDPVADGKAGPLTDLATDADTVSLLNATADLSPDGRTVATTWTRRDRRGETGTSLVLIDTARRRRKVLLRGTSAHGYAGPSFSPDGSTLAVTRVTGSTPTDTSYDFLELHPVAGGEPVAVEVGDLTIGEYVWAPDGQTLYVTGDLHSRGAILAVDPATGRVRKTIADDAVYSSLHAAADGRYLYALRSTIDTPPTPVRLTVRRVGEPRRLPAPGWVAGVPGTLEWVDTDVAGIRVGGWLCTPKGASARRPAPLMLWIHGGPHGSYNSWSWRWSPWLAVARGYAVLMPDPAMSTGYGHAGLNRGWPRLPDVVWHEVETLTDHVLQRKSLDHTRTALLGASFGGFMTNWIAGHSTRFKAIVTHAGLYALDQQHPTTDAAAHKVRVHRTPDDLPEWYAKYSPHHHAAKIRTPMLLTHGSRDYRVPISEALRLWWDLVSGFDGKPQDLPHRFLQFTSENHWVLSPSNSRVWNETVLGFVDQHALGKNALPDTVFDW
ncbi:S9 family peptidase [Nakamurella lactea]|uniref:S9 family peptidase n=1 Tax=Nakamurella lactea TaxID=459515 RepID=UPI000A00BB80|nr:prolyl oligopeptidase family serine peptidase [Nakamurella lactea]